MALDRSNISYSLVPPNWVCTQPRLMRVNPDDPDHVLLLYRLLEERTTEQSISHRRMPSFSEHAEFVRGRPYLAWYFVVAAGGDVVGAVYITRQREIGISIFAEHQRKGHGGMAVREVMRIHADSERPFLANIAPVNEPSIRFFESLGFRHIQNTYAHDNGSM